MQADNFIVRMRTPCLPCGKVDENGNLPPGTRECQSGDDPTVCSNNERYELDTEEDDITGNDIVVQWKLSGKCDSDNDGEEDDECGMVANPEEDKKSAIYEQFLNNKKDEGNYILMEFDTPGNDISKFPTTEKYFLYQNPEIELSTVLLSALSQPTLSFFLSSGLLTNINNKKFNVPYLEYQILTDEPIANPQTRIEVTATVDGNSFKKVIYKEVKKALIDFAVQN